MLVSSFLWTTIANAQLPDLILEPSSQETALRLRTDAPILSHSMIELSGSLSPFSWQTHENYGESSPRPFAIRSGSLLDVVVASSSESGSAENLPARLFWRLREFSPSELLEHPVPNYLQTPTALTGLATVDSDGFVYSFTTSSTGQYFTVQEDSNEEPFYAGVDFTYSYLPLGAGMASLNIQYNDPNTGTSGLIRFDSASSFESLFTDYSILGAETYSTDDLQFTTVIPTAPSLALPSLAGKILHVTGRDNNGDLTTQDYEFLNASQILHPSASREETELTSSYTLHQLGSNTYQIKIAQNGVEPASELILFIQTLSPAATGRLIVNTSFEEALDLIDYGFFTLQP